MYTSGPAQPAVLQSGGLQLIAARSQIFEGSSAAAFDPMLRTYLSDMARPYRGTVREDLLGQGCGHSYGEMAGALLRETVPTDQQVDLVVLAFAVPDVIPGRSTAAHLSHVCPGDPAAFAVCDQGTAAPFTALRLIGEHLRAGRSRRAVLVVAEQAALHIELPAPAAVPEVNAVVALLCGESGPARLGGVRQQAGVSAGQAARALGTALAGEATTAASGDLTVILGAGIAPAGEIRQATPPLAALEVPAAMAGEVIRAPSGQPCTGAWAELAGRLAEWAVRGRRVVLADYEPVLGYLCLAEFQVGQAAAPVSPGAA